jgi:hypothetical protein
MSAAQASASLNDLRDWAEREMSRSPDFVIGDNYLRRWWLVPRNPLCNVYLHEITKSDDDRALHDHPWANRSLIIAGSFIEITPDGEFVRNAGDVVEREAEALHRLVVEDGKRVLSLFMTGPAVREWGFACPQGWRHWRDFVDARDAGQVGRGCGE